MIQAQGLPKEAAQFLAGIPADELDKAAKTLKKLIGGGSNPLTRNEPTPRQATKPSEDLDAIGARLFRK